METSAAKWQAKETRVVETPCQSVCIRFAHSGRWLATADYDALVRRWDFSGDVPQAAGEWRGHQGWVMRLAWAKDDSMLYAVDSWGALLAHHGEDPAAAPRWSQPTAHDGMIRALALDSGGGRLATGGNDRTIKVWNAADGKPLRQWAADSTVYCLAWHPDGTTLVAGDLLGRVTEWNVETGERGRQIALEGYHLYERIQDVNGLKALAFIDGGQTLLVAGGKPTAQGFYQGMPRIDRIDWKSGQVEPLWLQENVNKGFVYDLAWHPAGFAAAAINGNLGEGEFALLRPGDKEPMFLEAKPPNAQSLALHPQGELLVVAATNRNSNANGAVFDKNGKYARNHSPLHLFQLSAG